MKLLPHFQPLDIVYNLKTRLVRRLAIRGSALFLKEQTPSLGGFRRITTALLNVHYFDLYPIIKVNKFGYLMSDKRIMVGSYFSVRTNGLVLCPVQEMTIYEWLSIPTDEQDVFKCIEQRIYAIREQGWCPTVSNCYPDIIKQFFPYLISLSRTVRTKR